MRRVRGGAGRRHVAWARGAAVQMASQLMNRTIARCHVLPHDSPLSDFSNTLPGKLLFGITGVRPAGPSMAGRSSNSFGPAITMLFLGAPRHALDDETEAFQGLQRRILVLLSVVL